MFVNNLCFILKLKNNRGKLTQLMYSPIWGEMRKTIWKMKRIWKRVWRKPFLPQNLFPLKKQHLPPTFPQRKRLLPKLPQQNRLLLKHLPRKQLLLRKLL